MNQDLLDRSAPLFLLSFSFLTFFFFLLSCKFKVKSTIFSKASRQSTIHIPKKTCFELQFAFTASLTMKHRWSWQVTRNQHRWCSPRVLCIPPGPGKVPCSSSPSLHPLPPHFHRRLRPMSYSTQRNNNTYVRICCATTK